MRTTLWAAGALAAAVLAGCGFAWAAPRDDELWQQADARIEKHRKTDIKVIVRRAGKPLPGAKVAIEQTQHAFLFGCNIFLFGRAGDPAAEEAYRQRFAALLNYATLPFYWPSYEPRQGQPDHQRSEQIARWCREHGIATKGHPLAWNFADPAWLPEDVEEVRRLQLARIEDCVSRFAGLIDRWDVVNEATHFDRPEFLRRAPRTSALWQKLGRVEFTRECFLHARKANPKAILLINDYRTDPAYEKLIEQLVDKDGHRLYDAIGIQSHMHGGVWPNQRIWEVCERFARFGAPLHFTETTIISGDPGRLRPGPGLTTPEGEAYQAREVVRFYTMLFSHPAVQAVTWWDFSDRGAWQRAPAGFLRADMSPKPAYHELMKLIKGKWWTRTEGTTDPQGTFLCRAFFGDYRVKVVVDGRAVDRVLKIAPGEKNEVTVDLPGK